MRKPRIQDEEAMYSRDYDDEKKKIKTMNLFGWVFNDRENLMNELKIASPKLRSSKAFKVLRQVAL